MNWFQRLFRRKKAEKEAVKSRNSYRSSSQPTGLERHSTDDIMNPLNPISPLNPYSPISVMNMNEDNNNYTPPSTDYSSHSHSSAHDFGNDFHSSHDYSSHNDSSSSYDSGSSFDSGSSSGSFD